MTHKPKLGDTGLTRGGYPYRVICDDRFTDEHPIVAAIKADGREVIGAFRIDGRSYSSATSKFDLMPPKRFVKIKLWKWGHSHRPETVFEDEFIYHDQYQGSATGKWVSDVVEIEILESTDDQGN